MCGLFSRRPTSAAASLSLLIPTMVTGLGGFCSHEAPSLAIPFCVEMGLEGCLALDVFTAGVLQAGQESSMMMGALEGWAEDFPFTRLAFILSFSD
nr:unnamed protein product [Digitaria exilis]